MFGRLIRIPAVACVVILQLSASVVLAGPPYVTDDPEPTDTGHWEVYDFATGVRVPRDTTGQAGIDANYGGAEDLQLTAVIPANFQSQGQIGAGDLQLAAKYRFLHQAEGSSAPDVSFFPRLFIPTAGHQFGPERFSYFLPFWAQEDWGNWSLFGGGGYDINQGPGDRNFWLTGMTLARTISDDLSLGAEIYRQTAALRGERTFTGLNLGVTWRLTEHWSLLASGGPGVQHERQEGEYDFYAALKADY